jgi:hypothetical protein
LNRARIARLLRALLPALLCAGSAHAITLDSFHDALPPNDCLPNLGLPIVFVGEYCDGIYCPPDPLASCDLRSAEQSGLPGVHGGAWRTVSVDSEDGVNPIEAQVRSSLGILNVRSAAGAAHEMNLQYGGGTLGGGRIFEMNLDLVAAGATELVVPVLGDVSPSRPLYFHISLATIESIPGGYAPHGTVLSFLVDHTGPIELPFSAFPPAAGFSLAHLDMLQIQVSECPLSIGCGGSPPPARIYSLGSISFPSSGPVPTARTTWARLKAHYR